MRPKLIIDWKRSRDSSVGLVSGSQIDVDAGQETEHQRLNQNHEATEQHDRKRNEDRDQAKEDAEDQVVHCHIEHQAHSEGDGTHAKRDDLNRQNEGREVPRGAHEMLDVARALFLQTVEVEEDEHDKRAAHCDVEAARGHRHSGDERHDVRKEHEEGGASDDREVLLRANRIHHALRHLVEVLEEDLGEGASC